MFAKLQHRRELRKELEKIESVRNAILDLKKCYSEESTFYSELKQEYDRLWQKAKDIEFELA